MSLCRDRYWLHPVVSPVSYVEPTTEPRCARKRQFQEEAEAIKEMHRLQRRSVQSWRLNVYFCARHQCWHIGNKSLAVMLAEREK